MEIWDFKILCLCIVEEENEIIDYQTWRSRLHY